MKKRRGRYMSPLKIAELNSPRKFVRNERTNKIYNNITQEKVEEINNIAKKSRGYRNVSKVDLFQEE